MSRCPFPLLFVLALAGPLAAQQPAPKIVVGKPPMALKLDPFYQKHADAGGLSIISSKNVPDAALVMAAELANHMLAKRPDLTKAMVKSGVKIAVMGKDELTTDIPEHSFLKPKADWDKRARGLGGIPSNPTTSCAEENLLGDKGDRYCGENILIHEFGHTIHEVGMLALSKTFDGRLKKAFEKATGDGLWAKTYAATNRKEYWAEGVQSYFDCNAQADPPNGVHNKVRTREQLKEYDPDLFALVDEVFDKNPWRWTPNGAHAARWKKK